MFARNVGFIQTDPCEKVHVFPDQVDSHAGPHDAVEAGRSRTPHLWTIQRQSQNQLLLFNQDVKSSSQSGRV